MVAETDSLIIEILRAMRAEQTNQGRKLNEIVLRLSGLENLAASIKADIAQHYTQIALLHGRSDGLLERIERIEKRLELQGP